MKHLAQNSFANALSYLIGVKGQQRLSVLIYHRVLAMPDFMRRDEPTKDQFEWQMELLARTCVPLSISDALRGMDEGNLPERAVCITFDDGYADNALVALPILEKWGIPATVFVSTGFLNGGIMWNDFILECFRCTLHEEVDLQGFGLGCYKLNSETARYAAAHDVLRSAKYMKMEQRDQVVEKLAGYSRSIPSDLMMTQKQVFDLSRQGIEIGAHTHNHPILASLNNSDAFNEIETSKRILEEITGRTIRYFAYPNGVPGKDYKDEHVSHIQNLGFEAAFSTQWGVSNRSTDRFQIPRFTPWDDSSYLFLTRLLFNQRELVSSHKIL